MNDQRTGSRGPARRIATVSFLAIALAILATTPSLPAQDAGGGGGSSESAFDRRPAASERAAPVIPDASALEALILPAFTNAEADHAIQVGETLQTIAEAAYGASLVWPFVWYFNRDKIADPERIDRGITLRIPRLRNGYEDPATGRALEAAYVLTYLQYRRISSRSAAERRWVLGQGGEAGADLGKSEWKKYLDSSDYDWARKKVKVSQGLQGWPGLNKDDLDRLGPFAKKSARDAFLRKVLAGDPLSVADMEAWLQALANSGELEAVQKTLSGESARPDAPPHIAFALALNAKRLGLAGAEYQALKLAAAAAGRRPDLVFNLALTSGRMKLLAGDKTLADALPAYVSVSTKPSGAALALDGASAGLSPLAPRKVIPGDHKLGAELDGYRKHERDFSVDYGEKLDIAIDLTPDQVATPAPTAAPTPIPTPAPAASAPPQAKAPPQATASGASGKSLYVSAWEKLGYSGSSYANSVPVVANYLGGRVTWNDVSFMYENSMNWMAGDTDATTSPLLEPYLAGHYMTLSPGSRKLLRDAPLLKDITLFANFYQYSSNTTSSSSATRIGAIANLDVLSQSFDLSWNYDFTGHYFKLATTWSLDRALRDIGLYNLSLGFPTDITYNSGGWGNARDSTGAAYSGLYDARVGASASLRVIGGLSVRANATYRFDLRNSDNSALYYNVQLGYNLWF